MLCENNISCYSKLTYYTRIVSYCVIEYWAFLPYYKDRSEWDQRQQKRSKGYLAHETLHNTQLMRDNWLPSSPLFRHHPAHQVCTRRGGRCEEAVHHWLPGHPGHPGGGTALHRSQKEEREAAEATPRWASFLWASWEGVLTLSHAGHFALAHSTIWTRESARVPLKGELPLQPSETP